MKNQVKKNLEGVTPNFATSIERIQANQLTSISPEIIRKPLVKPFKWLPGNGS